jgi:hypothetical protein
LNKAKRKVVEKAKAFAEVSFTVGDVCDGVGGKYRGQRGKIVRFTAVKVVLQLEKGAKTVMILQSSIEPVVQHEETDGGTISHGDCVKFENGTYLGEGYVAKKNRWMVTTHHI